MNTPDSLCVMSLIDSAAASSFSISPTAEPVAMLRPPACRLLRVTKNFSSSSTVESPATSTVKVRLSFAAPVKPNSMSAMEV